MAETTIGAGTARLERSNGWAAAREHVVERRAPPDRERSGEDGSVAEARGLNARRAWEPLVEAAAHGVREQVAVCADTAAEHDERDVGDRCDRGDVHRDAARLFGDDLAGHFVARPGGREDQPWVVGLLEHRPPSGGDRLRELTERARTRIEFLHVPGARI